MNEYNAPGKQELQIDVTISEKKRNDINPEVAPIELEIIPKKVDNDMESSDLSFSEERNQIDEHAYEIGELGKFDVEKSFSDLVGGINDDSSVDFSDQENEVLADELDFGGYSHEAINEYSMSSYSSDDLNEFYGNPSFSAGSYSDEDDYFLSGRPYRQPYYYDDEWDHFVEHEKKHYAPYY